MWIYPESRGGKPVRGHMRHRLPRLALLTVLGTAAAAAAGPPVGAPTGAPVPIRPTEPPPPPPVEITGGHPVVSAHVARNAAALSACAVHSRTPLVKARVRVTWDAKGRAKTVFVGGSTAAFGRCARTALLGAVPAVSRHSGSGVATIVVRRPPPAPVLIAKPEPPPPPVVKPEPPKPAPPKPPVVKAGDIHSCRADSDCTLHFRLHACVPSDPVAVNQRDPEKVRATYPVRHLACGMGGPQYDQLRFESENRWSARCEQSRCVVHDNGRTNQLGIPIGPDAP